MVYGGRLAAVARNRRSGVGAGSGSESGSAVARLVSMRRAPRRTVCNGVGRRAPRCLGPTWPPSPRRARDVVDNLQAAA